MYELKPLLLVSTHMKITINNNTSKVAEKKQR
jgi:hypothetical protein